MVELRPARLSSSAAASGSSGWSGSAGAVVELRPARLSSSAATRGGWGWGGSAGAAVGLRPAWLGLRELWCGTAEGPWRGSAAAAGDASGDSTSYSGLDIWCGALKRRGEIGIC